ncbi:MAG: NAD(P)-binding protein [Burkholderiaceae bacterium]
MATSIVEIVGAGPAGLSAAISARSAGAQVVVYERRNDVGARFQGDFQGLENWTSNQDVLEELSNLGIALSFDCTPVREVVYFCPDTRAHEVRSATPLFYLVRRGNEAGALDHALKSQALDAGVTIHFNCRRQHLPNGGVVAEGPHRADIIAVGYVFETDMADGCYLATSDQLAAAGYSYLLIDQGRGTVAACLFDNFHAEREYLERTVAFFKQATGLRWHRARRFGGNGNVDRVHRPAEGDRHYVGEVAGFQDALFGFGLRYALTSGHLAGAALTQTRDTDLSYGHLRGLNAASILNRWVFDRLGERGRAFLIKRVVDSGSPQRALQRIYTPARWKTALAGRLPRSPLLPVTQEKPECDCTWCRSYRKPGATTHGLAQ